MASGQNAEQLSEKELRDKSAAGILTEEETAQLNRLKGKGASEPEPEQEADDEADDPDAGSGDDDGGEEDEQDADEEDPEEKAGKKRAASSSQPPKKKQKGGSSKAKDDDEDESEPEIVKGLSGDEVDATNIIEGGRRSRRGRGNAPPQYRKLAGEDSEDDDDEW